MNPEDISFEEFFAERVKHKGLSVKKLADMTGISPRHLTEIARGNFAALPSAPYVRGYLMRLGQALEFDAETWWQRIKIDRRVKNSGSTDALPQNRFLKRPPTRMIMLGAIALIVIIYFGMQFSKIFGKPSLALTNPTQNPFTTTISPVTLQGVAGNADSVSLNGENVTLSPDGSWSKSILLSNGPNQITITAKKFLGRETSMTEEIIYEAPIVTPAPTGTKATSTGSAPSSSLTQ